MTDTTRSELDIDETQIETNYGTVTLTFAPADITWHNDSDYDDSERLAREELALDAAMLEVSNQLSEEIES